MQKVPETPITIEVRAALEEYTQRLMKLYPERFTESDPEAWRDEYRKKQAAGVKFECLTQLPSIKKWCQMWCSFDGNEKDYREVPQEVQKDGGVWIPEAAREILKGWHKQGLKFNCCDIFLCLEKPQFSDRREYYTINKQPIPSGMSVETVEAMWRQGLRVEYNHHGKAWRDVTSEAEWNRGLFEYTEILQCLRIPDQPIPEKLLEVPQEISIADKLAFTENNVPQEPHAAERALYWAQREAGTNEVWQAGLNGEWISFPVDMEPGWHDGHVYRVKPMKLTARVVSKIAKHKCPQDYVFNGTREEYRAECEKYGYVVISEIKEVIEEWEVNQ